MGKFILVEAVQLLIALIRDWRTERAEKARKASLAKHATKIEKEKKAAAKRISAEHAKTLKRVAELERKIRLLQEMGPAAKLDNNPYGC